MDVPWLHVCVCRVPGVVDLCGTADDATNMYLVFEPCAGGDLYKRLAHKGLYDEAQLCSEVIPGCHVTAYDCTLL